MQLGHKQIEEDPWNSLEETFPVGSIHEGTVTRRDDKGAIVQLPYGLEGFAPARHLRKEDDKTVSAEEIAQFMVIEFDRNDKKIVFSHSRIWEQAKEEEKNAEFKEKRAETESTKKAVKNIQSKVEKTTLGDLSALADLKKKMDDNEGEASAKRAELKSAPKAEVTDSNREPKAEIKPQASETKAEAPAEVVERKTEAPVTRAESPAPETEAPAEVAAVKTGAPAEIKTEAVEVTAVEADANIEDKADKTASVPKAKKEKTEEKTEVTAEKKDVAEVKTKVEELSAEANVVPEENPEENKGLTEGKAE